MKKVYLGDSVYLDFDGWNLILTTDNGSGPTNEIVLEPEVYRALELVVNRLRQTVSESVAESP